MLNKIQQEVATSVRVQVPADASDSLLESLELLRTKFDAIPVLSLQELDKANETLYYRAGNAQIEIQPEVFRELTTSWSSSEDFKQSFQQTWNNVHELARDSNTTEEFYKKLHTQYKGGGGAKAQFDLIKVLSAGGSFDFNLDLTWDEQTDEKRSVSRSSTRRLRTRVRSTRKP